MDRAIREASVDRAPDVRMYALDTCTYLGTLPKVLRTLCTHWYHKKKKEPDQMGRTKRSAQLEKLK